MNTPQDSAKIDLTDLRKYMTTIVTLWEEGKLDKNDLEILKQIAERNRIWRDSSVQENSEEESKVVTSKHLLEAINQDICPYWIYGTTDKGKFNTTWDTSLLLRYQSQKMKELGIRPKEYLSCLDGLRNKVSESIYNDPKILLVEYIKNPSEINSPNHSLLKFRVADNRVGQRGGTHTTVFILPPRNLDKFQFEKLVKEDTRGLKEVMRTILEKANSPLRWAEQGIEKSFLL
jgi:hypothetical protein